MRPEDFEYLAQFMRRRAGIVLAPHKSQLVEGRLAPVARRFGFRNVESLLHELRFAREALARAVMEAMTTNDSSFFRDKAVFEHLRTELLPKLVEARRDRRHLRLWSAACAAGQEAYSLAMLLDEMKLVEQGWSIDLIATDLCSDLIARAEEGIYTEYEVERGLTPRRLGAHFAEEGTSWRVNDRLKRLVSFRAFNLLDSFGWLHELDIVLCRNVLIFFDARTKSQIAEKIADVLAPHGVLVLGHAEFIEGIGTHFDRDGAIGCCFQRCEDETIIGYPVAHRS